MRASIGGWPGADDDAWSLRSCARELTDQREPSLVLQAIVQAMKSKGGKHAVLIILQCAREYYCNEHQSIADVDELVSLFAECWEQLL